MSTQNTQETQNVLKVNPVPVGMLGKYTVHTVDDFGGLVKLQERALCVLRGKRGAEYLICDNGQGYCCTVWNLGTNTRGWGGQRAFGTPWDKTGGFRDRAEVLRILGR
jgi:hypothetical protein